MTKAEPEAVPAGPGVSSTTGEGRVPLPQEKPPRTSSYSKGLQNAPSLQRGPSPVLPWEQQ